MTMPKCYEPEQGYMFQIIGRDLNYSRSFEHVDYAKDKQERTYLLSEYSLAYGQSWELKAIRLPLKYHKKIKDGIK